MSLRGVAVAGDSLMSKSRRDDLKANITRNSFTCHLYVIICLDTRLPGRPKLKCRGFGSIDHNYTASLRKKIATYVLM